MEKIMKEYVQAETAGRERGAGQNDMAGQMGMAGQSSENRPAESAAQTGESGQTQRGFQRETRRQLTGPESESAIRLYYCGSESCTPGHFFGPAVRPHYLIHFIRNGKGTYLRKDEVHELSRGDAFLILPGETTKYIADEKEPWDYTWVAFDGTNAEALLRCCGFLSGNLVYRSPDEEARLQLLRQADAFESCFQDEKSNVLELLGNFYLLFSCMYPEGSGQGSFSFAEEMSRSWAMHTGGKSDAFRPESADAAKAPSGQELYFMQAVSYLRHNFSYPVRIEQLARQIGVSRSYLYKAFLNCSGKSIQQYLQDLRLEEACRLLADTRRTVTDIAYSCGFPDSPSFCRIFRKVYGRTPLQFRQRMAKGSSGPAAEKAGTAEQDTDAAGQTRQAASLNAEQIYGIHV